MSNKCISIMVIYEIMVDGNIYTFDQNGDRLNAEAETIHGIIISGNEIDVPIEDILHVKVKRVDEARTTALVVGVILTIIVAAIAIVKAAAASPSKLNF